MWNDYLINREQQICVFKFNRWFECVMQYSMVDAVM